MKNKQENKQIFLTQVEDFYKTFAKSQVINAKKSYENELKENNKATNIGFIFLAIMGILIFSAIIFENKENLDPGIPIAFVFVIGIIGGSLLFFNLSLVFLKKKDPLEWLREKFIKIGFLRDIFISEKLNISWNKVIYLNMIEEEQDLGDETVRDYYLIIKYQDDPKEYSFHAGKDILRELMFLVKDFCEYQVLIHYKCKNCGEMLSQIVEGKCPYCFTQVDYSGVKILRFPKGKEGTKSDHKYEKSFNKRRERDTRELLEDYYDEFGKKIAENARETIQMEPSIFQRIIVILFFVFIITSIFFWIKDITIFWILLILVGLFGIAYSMGEYSSYTRKKAATPVWILKRIKYRRIKEYISLENNYLDWRDVKEIKLTKIRNKIKKKTFSSKVIEDYLFQIILKNQIKPFNIKISGRFPKEFVKLLHDIFLYLKLRSNPCPNCSSDLRIKHYQFCDVCGLDLRGSNLDFQERLSNEEERT
jgi:hypothetical protein